MGGPPPGALGLIQQLEAEVLREGLGGEGVLRGGHGGVRGVPKNPLCPPKPPVPPPLTCSSLAAVGRFLGFLVSASLRNWWKLGDLEGGGVMGGPRTPNTPSSHPLHPKFPPHTPDVPWIPTPSTPNIHCSPLHPKHPSRTPNILPAPPPGSHPLHPKYLLMPPLHPKTHHRLFSFNLGGWKLLLAISISALGGGG